MIQVKVTKHSSNIQKIVIEGHSLYDVEGKDIVCASVSSMAILTANMILKLDPKNLSYKQRKGYMELVICQNTETISLLLDTFLTLLKELEQNYPKYIKIYE